jgi:homeodomain-containing protein
LEWIELSPRKFGRWQQRFGKLNEHNGLVPRDHQIEDWERQAIITFLCDHPLKGYRRLAFMMLDRNLGGPVSTSTVYRVLKAAVLLQDRFSRPLAKASYSPWNHSIIGISTSRSSKRSFLDPVLLPFSNCEIRKRRDGPSHCSRDAPLQESLQRSRLRKRLW